MSYILRTVKPSNLMSWIKTNDPGSLRATAHDSWRAYLIGQTANAGTVTDMENKFTTAFAGSTLHDKWAGKVSATPGSKTEEKCRNLYR
jgi:hypothetical protein